MTLWPSRKSWSPRTGGSRLVFCAALGLLGLIVLPGSASSIVVDWLAPRHYSFDPGRQGPRSIVFALPPVSWRDLRQSDAPHLREIVSQGGVGLMPAAPPVPGSDSSGIWATLGAARAAVGSLVTPAPELVGGQWRVDLDGTRAANAEAHTGATLGLAGQMLHELDLTTAVVSPGRNGGEAALALADEDGLIDGIWAGERLTDSAELRDALEQALRQHAVILVDLSAMDSVEAADQVIGDALETLGSRSQYLVMALSPREGAAGMNPTVRLSPVAVRWTAWPTGSRSGLLTSASTRWEGIVTAADIAPTLLEWWAGQPPARIEMTGRVMRIVESYEAPQELDRLDLMLRERHRLQVRAGALYGAYLALLSVAALAMALWWREALRWLAAPALLGSLLPVGLLVSPLAGPGQAGQLLVAAGVAVGGTLAALLRPRSEQSLAVAMLAGAAIIAADTVFGAPLMRRSALGFSVVPGSRFYGIGNECIGVLAAMATIGLGALMQAAPQRKKVAALAAIAVALVVGMPWWGANWGGYVAIAAGLVSVWVLTRKRRARAAVLGLVLIGLAALVPVILDFLRPAAERTHIGSAAALLGGRADALVDMALRKLWMNWRLAAMASWWWVLAPLASAAAVGMLRRSGPARETLARKPYLSAGVWGAVVSALVAMVLNDSGVVSMGLALAVTLGALIFVGARGR